MRQKFYLPVVVLVWLVLAVGNLLAAEEVEWCPTSIGPVTTWTAPVCGAKTWYAIPRFYFTNFKKFYDNNGDKQSVGDDTRLTQQQQMIFAAYGLSDKLELNAQVALVQNHATIGDLTANSTGWADSYLILRDCFLMEQAQAPCITGMLQLKLPTGKYQHADADKLGTDITGTGSTDLGVGLVATKKLKPVILHGDLSIFHPFEVTVDDVEVQYGNWVTYDLGAEYFIENGVNFMLEMNGFWQGKEEDDGTTVDESDVTYLQLTPGIGYTYKSFTTLLAYQMPLSGKNAFINETWIINFLVSF
ncbi:MAG: transporter [bacterium]|nr:transporter [bacterium]MDD5756729.1 transporter [bacterium]